MSACTQLDSSHLLERVDDVEAFVKAVPWNRVPERIAGAHKEAAVAARRCQRP